MHSQLMACEILNRIYLSLNLTICVPNRIAPLTNMQLDERLEREGVKSHKEKVEELNKYLSKLSEHHDMYIPPISTKEKVPHTNKHPGQESDPDKAPLANKGAERSKLRTSTAGIQEQFLFFFCKYRYEPGGCGLRSYRSYGEDRLEVVIYFECE